MSAIVLAMLIQTPPPICAEQGKSFMDPRLEHALGISTARKVKEPTPAVLVSLR